VFIYETQKNSGKHQCIYIDEANVLNHKEEIKDSTKQEGEENLKE
jgi:hypothetical protein